MTTLTLLSRGKPTESNRLWAEEEKWSLLATQERRIKLSAGYVKVERMVRELGGGAIIMQHHTL